MKGPIDYQLFMEHDDFSQKPVTFFDPEGLDVAPQEVRDAVNNAAAGPWKKGPVPDGEEGDKILFEDEKEEGVDLAWWSHKAWADGPQPGWYRSQGHEVEQVRRFARVNIPEIGEGK